MSEQELILRTLEKLGEADATIARLTSELAAARAERDDVKAANDELGKQIARLAEQAAAAERVKNSAAKMCDGVWAAHESQFAAQSAELAALRERLIPNDAEYHRQEDMREAGFNPDSAARREQSATETAKIVR